MKREAAAMIAAGALVVGLGFGARSVFGVILEPLSADLGWPRETFSLALALQNLVWGFAQPAFGALADRLGDRRALWLGFVCYLAGMALAATGTTPLAQHLGTGLLIGFGVAGTGFGLVLSAVGRRTPEAERPRVMALTAAAGSTGQMLMPLLAGAVTALWGWQATILVTGALLLLMAGAIPVLVRRPIVADEQPEPDIRTLPLLAHALGQPSYVLLNFGFFVCGFHVGFMTAHLPAYVTEVCGSVALGGTALAVVGGANILGTLFFGNLGGRFPKPWVLSSIYAIRAVAIAGLMLVTPTPFTVLLFSAVVGFAWLATVPLTSALVATLFGARYLGTLYGVVFLAHQVGAFLGAWAGGRLHDVFGSYDAMWWAAVALGLFSALVHLPVRERRIALAV